MPQVPSNLIPTTITQLPTVPVASADSWVLITYQGKSYKITAGNLVGTATVPTSRLIIAGTGLTGGGSLASDVTLSIANSGVTDLQLDTTGVTAGVYGTSSTIPVLTINNKGRITSASSVALSVSNLTGGSANRIPYQINSTTTDFIGAPSVSNTVLTWNGSSFVWQAASAGSGTVTSVSATSPLTITGSPTVNPTINIPAATTLVSGYLTSTDWNTFNNKQPAGSYLTTVTADAPLSGSGTSASHLSIPAATASVNGYLTSADWSTFNSKQPAGAYLTTVTADSPLTGLGTSASHLSIPAATTSTSGYLTSTDWNTFNNKVGAITSTDGSVTITGTTTVDLSVAVSASTTNVICQVRNTTGATLTKGTVVYITGATGQTPTVSKALATSDATSAQTLGLMTADLANNSNGYVTIIGLVTDVNTSAYSDGQQLYLSGTTAGTMTATKPQAPLHLVYVAVVEYAHPIHGKLFVKVQNGYELDEIHDVQITSPANGQTIIYDSATSLWKNALVNLASNVTGNLPVTNLNSGTGASGTTFWRGDGTWATPAGGGSGTVTQVDTTGSVSGITLTGGPITTTGTVTLGGSLDLSVPPAIGGTTPNSVTATELTVTQSQLFTTVTPGNAGEGVVTMVDAGGGYDVLDIYMDDGLGGTYPVRFSAGTIQNGCYVLSPDYLTNYQYIQLACPSGMSTFYTLTFPPTAGSNNQVLKTDGSGNLDWANKFVLGAGTATAGTAPIKFTSGTNLTTAEAGAMEYDGKVAYFTPSNTSRALLPSPYIYRKNTATTLASATGNQAIFGLTSGVTVAANTIYEIECEFQLTTTGTTSHTEAFGFTLATATVTNMGVAVNRLSGNTTSTALGTYLTSVTPVVVTGALTTAQVGIYRVRGTIAFGTGGSINPVIAFSAAPGGTSTIVLGGFMKMTPIGTTGSNVSIGTWA